MELKAQDIAAYDAAYWAVNEEIKLPQGRFSFVGRKYLEEPMRSQFRRRVLMKGTQGGASLIIMLQMLHDMLYDRYPLGVLYLFPTTDDMREYSKSRFNPLISANNRAIGRFLQDTDTASLKKVGESAYLYLRGANLTEKLDIGYNESTKLKGISVDAVVFDEIDLMDPGVVAKARGRYGASKVKDEVYIGNPGVPGRGIDAFWQQSDQRHWWITCGKCTEETCAELEFFDNPAFIKIRDNGTGFLGCKRCGAQLDTDNGNWKADVDKNSDKVHGYRWSQLLVPDNDPAEILHDYRFPPEGNLGDVMRTRLGMPWISAENQLTRVEVYESCGTYPIYGSHHGPCAMGVDVGDTKHIVIGCRTGQDSYEILKIARLESWDDIHDIAGRFNVRSAVVDLRPFADAARAFQKAERYRVYLCEYSDSTPLGSMYNDTTGLVRVNRTEVFDATGKMFRDRKVAIPRKCPEIDEFVRQVTNPVCVEEQDKRRGILVRRYRGENDHYRNAMNYFLLAASGGKVGIVRNRDLWQSRPRRAVGARTAI